MGKTVQLRVGTSLQSFKVPFENVVFGQTACKGEGIGDLKAAVRQSLTNMTGDIDTANLNTGSRVVIISDDYTRPTPVYEILPELIDFL